MIRNSMTWAMCLGMLVSVSVQAKLREPMPFEDSLALYVFEAEPAPSKDNKTAKTEMKAHVAYPQKVVTDGKYSSDSQTLIMVLKGFKNVPVSLDYPVGDLKAGEYRWYASIAIGGKAHQKVQVLAGPDAEHLTPRGTISQNNTASWKNDWFTGKTPVHIDAKDKFIRFTFTGAATNRKLIDAVVLEPLAQ